MTKTHPGILASLDLEYAHFGWQEKGITRKLAKTWFITFAKVATFKNSVFSFLFARPTTLLKESFRLDREVLVLFTRDRNFEARSLDFVDKTIFEFQNRLDKLCIILVSADPKIREKIKELTAQEPETRLIIPFSYDEFLADSSGEVVMSRLKEFFYGRDLFSFESPLHNDTYFFGRATIVQFLYDKYKAGENSGLFGLRKIGKTSVLYAVKRYLNFREEFAIFLDSQEPAFHGRRWNELLELIIINVFSLLRSEKGIEIEPSTDYSEKNASISFEKDLIAAFNAVNQKRLLLIFDEIENITYGLSPSEHWNKENDFVLFWQAIRSIFQKNPNLFAFIVAGVNPHIIELPQANTHDNPIYRMVTAKYLPFFTAQQVREMVVSIGNYMGLEFDEEIFTYLTEDYGGHPFLIRQVCSRVHALTTNVRPAKVSKYTYKKEKPQLDAALRDYIDLIVNVLRKCYPKEYRLLELLAIDDKIKFAELAHTNPAMIQHLQGYNLVENSGASYFIKIKAVESFVAENSRLVKTASTLEDKWDEISKRRNRLESNLRKAVKLVIKTKHGPVKGKTQFLSIIESEGSRKGRLDTLGFDAIFDGNNEVYFEDLRKYVKSNWSDFERIFGEAGLFDVYMPLINKYRIDAHAKGISDEMYAVLVAALNWLNGKIDDFLA